VDDVTYGMRGVPTEDREREMERRAARIEEPPDGSNAGRSAE
jgi:hypothetical protein